ncbi:MAG TPA: sigma-70 family RNA polymerase sigma factor [Candidatus Solibacter sp.]|nr:sigma-70 family RNA polymerase sigma factor [Candidatus Solibacter sp.]
MNVHISYKAGKTPDVEREFQHQLQKLRPRLQVYKPDLVHFHAIVDPRNGQGATTSLNLRLPSGQMAVQESGENIVAVIKAAFTDLVGQLTRHKDLLRGHWNRKGRRASSRDQIIESVISQEQPSAAWGASRVRINDAGGEATGVPPVGTLRDGILQEGVSKDVSGWINVNLPRLQRFIESDLQYRIASGQLREGLISQEEVIDEVIVSALSQDEAKPETLSLDSWFNRLVLRAFRVLAESNADTAGVSLDAPAGVQNVTGSDENVLQYHQPDDSLPEESVIADPSLQTPEEIFANEEMVAQLDLVLHKVRPQDREAFVLYSVEGFTVNEIARISDQPPEHIRERIHHARKRIQQELPPHNEFKRSLLRGSRVA